MKKINETLQKSLLEPHKFRFVLLFGTISFGLIANARWLVLISGFLLMLAGLLNYSAPSTTLVLKKESQYSIQKAKRFKAVELTILSLVILLLHALNIDWKLIYDINSSIDVGNWVSGIVLTSIFLIICVIVINTIYLIIYNRSIENKQSLI